MSHHLLTLLHSVLLTDRRCELWEVADILEQSSCKESAQFARKIASGEAGDATCLDLALELVPLWKVHLVAQRLSFPGNGAGFEGFSSLLQLGFWESQFALLPDSTIDLSVKAKDIAKVAAYARLESSDPKGTLFDQMRVVASVLDDPLPNAVGSQPPQGSGDSLENSTCRLMQSIVQECLAFRVSTVRFLASGFDFDVTYEVDSDVYFRDRIDRVLAHAFFDTLSNAAATDCSTYRTQQAVRPSHVLLPALPDAMQRVLQFHFGQTAMLDVDGVPPDLVAVSIRSQSQYG